VIPDLICLRLQETHLTAKCQPCIPHYTISRKGRPPHHGKYGGLCMRKNPLSYSQVTIRQPERTEVMDIEIDDFCIHIYSRPSNTLDQYISLKPNH